MTDLHPSERETKAKKATSSSFFRFLSKKTNQQQQEDVLLTARGPALSAESNIPPFQQPAVPSKSIPKLLDRKINVKAAVAAIEPLSEELKAEIATLKVSTPPNADNDVQLAPFREIHASASDTGTDPLQSINSKVLKVLYKNDNQRWANFWKVVEDATQVRREKLAYVFAGIFMAICVWSSLGDFVCTFIGFAYPAIATYQILNPTPRSPPVTNAECVHWFRYWSIFGFMQCIDVIFGKYFALFPPYSMCKVLLYLAAQYSHWNVSGFLYSYVVMPAVKWIKRFNERYIFTK